MVNKKEINSPSRKGRYRKILVSNEFFENNAASFSSIFRNLNQVKKDQRLSEPDFLALGLILMLSCRRRDAFQTHKTVTEVECQSQKSESGYTLNDFLLTVADYGLDVGQIKKIQTVHPTLEQFLANVRFRGIPDSARRALIEWRKGNYPLQLFHYIPTVDEVFDLQKEGRRCITFFLSVEDLVNQHHERDPLSFIVHDLIHASEFYENAVRAKQQIGFYLWLDSIQNDKFICELIKVSDGFKRDWNYLRSDMNSYCGHLLKTFQATFLIHVKALDLDFDWESLIDRSGLSESEKAVFKKVNQVEWQTEDFLFLEKTFDSYGVI